MSNNKNKININHLLQNSFPSPFWADLEELGRGTNSPYFLKIGGKKLVQCQDKTSLKVQQFNL